MNTATMTTATPKPYIGAGIILVNLQDSQPRLLCLRGRQTGIWSFPKGHPEDTDNNAPLRTAVRETYEETGYSVVNDYTIIGDSIRYGKRHYWVGIMNPNVMRAPRILRADEHSEVGWFTPEEVSALPGNTDVRAWAKKWARQVGFFPALLRYAICQLPSLSSAALTTASLTTASLTTASLVLTKQPTCLNAQVYTVS